MTSGLSARRKCPSVSCGLRDIVVTVDQDVKVCVLCETELVPVDWWDFGDALGDIFWGHAVKRSAPLRRTPLKRSETPLPRGKGLRRVSRKRAAENRTRRQVLLEAFGANPACARCGAPADDAHELLRRSQGGSITDVSGIVPVCRDCHNWIGNHPQQAHDDGWTIWSWEAGAA